MGEHDATVDETKGRLKKAAGEITDDDKLRTEGQVDKATGKVKNKIEEMAEKVKEAVTPKD
jgi:uncharacterized protein YjbJ (UPF0337 family)